ncbi:putative phthalate 4, 5-dioxygenase oxygenase reductase subunit [Neurospora tetraspora]|uniref:Phthalate 4, 5-dioxygenase oxygenase reductase subunit n=1 Tax=Neurospora tetraspora TaxID=94610 RepID=A0AAE0JKR2_9PEZI|nr:putative phthalate 4, 5-dioxygenase oxygenase reductase subunit [Neurospora tetraspora]
MAESQSKINLYAPFERDTILEVRASKMKKMRGLDVMSGIDKTIIDGPVYVGRTGLEGDESDPTFHGGIDKAVHGYCSSHYPSWASEHPSAAVAFVPGGFGENLVTAHMNERNVCIGDTMIVGSPSALTSNPDSCLLLQVSLPRQPCFKLNHRFQLKKFAPLTWKHSRTGWYYRVLRPGFVQAGDEIRLVSRPHPEWTIERIQEYLHRNQDDEAMNAELAQIEELGAESRDAFKARVARSAAQKKRAEKLARWRDFRVVERHTETPRIVSFVLEAIDPIVPPPGDEKSILLKPGAHARVKLGNDLVRAYSIVGPPDDASINRFQLGIALEPQSRGGSAFLHSQVFKGHVLQVSANFTNAVPNAPGISHHIFVAGGVGITAFLTSLEYLQSIHVSCELHYAVRSSSSDDIPFRDRLSQLNPGTVKIYDKTKGQRLNIEDIVKNIPWNTMLYFCGPSSLVLDAATQVRKYNVPEGEVHFEAFEADISGDPFEVVVANRNDKTLQVQGEETLLEVLQKEFGDEEVGGSCCVGNCGTCKVNLKGGRVEHRGTALTAEEKGSAMLACVSRGVGRIVIEI